MKLSSYGRSAFFFFLLRLFRVLAMCHFNSRGVDMNVISGINEEERRMESLSNDPPFVYSLY